MSCFLEPFKKVVPEDNMGKVEDFMKEVMENLPSLTFTSSLLSTLTSGIPFDSYLNLALLAMILYFTFGIIFYIFKMVIINPALNTLLWIMAFIMYVMKRVFLGLLVATIIYFFSQLTSEQVSRTCAYVLILIHLLMLNVEFFYMLLHI